MTSCRSWWNIAICTLATSQVVLSGVLHSGEEIRKSHQQLQNEDDLGHDDGIYKYRLDDQKNVEENSKTINYVIDKGFKTPLSNDENNITETNNIDNQLKYILEESVSEDSVEDKISNNESKTVHHDGKILEKSFFNKTDIKINSDEDNLKDRRLLNKVTSSDEIIKLNKSDVIQPEKLNNLENQSTKEEVRIGKLDHEVYDLQKENELDLKNHNKREFNYPHHFIDDDHFIKSGHHFENDYNRFIRNPHYNDDNYYRYNDYHDTNIEQFNQRKHNRYEENDLDDEDDDDDDDEDDSESGYDDDDEDLNELLKRAELEEEEEEEEEGDDDNFNEEIRKMSSDSNPDEEALHIFTYFLESIINQKFKELEKNQYKPHLDHKSHVSKVNQTKQGSLSKQRNDTQTKNKTKDNIANKNFEDELHSSLSKDEERNTRNIKGLSNIFNQNDQDLWDDDNHQSTKELENHFKQNAMFQQPFVVMRTQHNLQGKTQDNQVQTNANVEDEEPSDTKKLFRRNTDSVLRPHFHAYNNHDIETSRNFGYPPYPLIDNAVRMNLNNDPWIINNKGPYIRELPVRRTPLHIPNSHNSDVSYPFDLHDEFDNSDRFEDKCTYTPDRVSLYSFDNVYQNSPDDENLNNQYSHQPEENNRPLSLKVKRDLRNELENSEKKDSNNDSVDFIERNVLAVEALIATHILDTIEKLPKQLSHHEKEVITKNIIKKITTEISHQDIMDYVFKRKDIKSYYEHTDPLFGNDRNLIKLGSKIKREMENHHYSKEDSKSCIIIKNLNLFYEFGEEGRNCIHIPKYIKDASSENSINYQKRHSSPYHSYGNLLEKDNTYKDIHDLHSILYDTKVVPKRNSQNKITKPRDDAQDNKSNDESDETVSDLTVDESEEKFNKNEMITPDDEQVTTYVSNLENSDSDAEIEEETANTPTKNSPRLPNNRVNLVTETPTNKKLNNRKTMSILSRIAPIEPYQLETQTEQETDENNASTSKVDRISDRTENNSLVKRSKAKSSIGSINSPPPIHLRQLEKADATEKEHNSKDDDTDDGSDCVEGEVCYRNSHSQANNERNKQRENKKRINTPENIDESADECIEEIEYESEGENKIKHKKCKNRTGGRKIILITEDPESTRDEMITEDNLDNYEKLLMSDSQIRDENDDAVKSVFSQGTSTRRLKSNKNNENGNSRKVNKGTNKHLNSNEHESKSQNAANRGDSESRKLKYNENKWIPEEGDSKEQGKRQVQEESDEEISEEKSKNKKGSTKKVISNHKKDYYIKENGITNEKGTAQKNTLKQLKVTDYETSDNDQYIDDNSDDDADEDEDDDLYDDESYSDDENENYPNDKLNINVKNKQIFDSDDDVDEKSSLSTIRKRMNQNEEDLTDSDEYNYSDDDHHQDHRKVDVNQDNKEEEEEEEEEEVDAQYDDDDDEDEGENEFKQNKEVQDESDEDPQQKEIEKQIIKPVKPSKIENKMKDEDYSQTEDEEEESQEYQDNNEEYEDKESDFKQQKKVITSSATKKENKGDEYVEYVEEEDEYTNDEPTEEYEEEYSQERAKKPKTQVSNRMTAENRENYEVNKEKDYVADEYDDNEEYDQDQDVEKNYQQKKTQEIKIQPKILGKDNNKKTFVVLNDVPEEEYEDEEDENVNDSPVTIIDVTNDVQNELRKSNLKNQVKEELENQNQDNKNQLYEFLNEELNKPQTMHKRKTKGTLIDDQRKTESFSNEEKINHDKTYFRNNKPSHLHSRHDDHDDYESDYVRKSDVEKIINEILESSSNPKQDHEIFYNQPQHKYKELVKDMASYFAKKNLTAGDDIYIYEEYGSKHGDNDAIYLSGTKLYQNGVPKKDAQNFNIIIKKPHHETEEDEVSEESEETELEENDNLKHFEQNYIGSDKPFIVREQARHHNKHNKSKRHYEHSKTPFDSKTMNKQSQKRYFFQN